MPRKTLKRILPDHKTMREHPHLQKFGRRLAEPKLWHLNRRSVAGGLALGLFSGFLPVVGQMFIAVALAIFFRVSLPIAVISSWFSNPLTYAPVFFFAYKLGVWILQMPIEHHSFDLSWQWLTNEFLLIWQPLLLGSLICGIISALLGILFVRLLWRLMVIRNWLKRKQKNGKK
ncbi:MAG: ATP-binding protein [Methylophaga sp.]|nr:MAG: ATP-binding protein [Methylophaga sp.]